MPVPHVCSGQGGQKMPSGPLELELQMAVVLCMCWELNVDPLKEQPVSALNL